MQRHSSGVICVVYCSRTHRTHVGTSCVVCQLSVSLPAATLFEVVCLWHWASYTGDIQLHWRHSQKGT